MAIVVAGFSKVYVGEIIEKGGYKPNQPYHCALFLLIHLYIIAREVMEEWGDAGAIRPEHLREAHRRYKLEREAQSNVGKTLFRR